jgi:SLT domain-containing protein
MNNEPLGFTYTGEDFQPNTITFNSAESTWVMQITADRKIVVNEDVEVSEAAQHVLEALQPLLLQTNQVKELTDEEIYQTWVEAKNTALNTRGSDFVEVIFARAILRKAQEK